MVRILGMAALALSASGCVTTSDRPIPVEAEAISYETGPCFGACPIFKLTVRPDGTGTFEGRRFTAVTGERSFTLTAAEYRAFARQLAPLRPRSGSVRLSGDQCAQMATDLPSAEVTWFDPIGSSQSYYFYYGCDMERNRAIAERLRRAPSLLPPRVREMIGSDL